MECVNEGWIKFDTEKDKNKFIHLVRDIAPSAESRWIPVSERLPKPYEYCLWTTTDGRVVYHHCDGLFSNYTAWMPLPKPYKEVQE